VTTTTTLGTVRGLFASSHPVPSIVVAALTTTFAWALGLQWWQVAVVFLAMISNQLGIGLGNDWLDSARDRAAGRSDKPLAAGAIPPRLAQSVAISLGILALALSAILGVWAVACQTVMLFAGWWYNAHAKGHWSSALSYLLGFGLLPVFPSLALQPPQLPVWWVVVVAGLLGVGAHFANALPDLLGDAQTDVRGLPQRLGPKVSGLVIASTVGTATVIITTAGSGLPVWLRLATAAIAMGAAAMAATLAFRNTPPRVIFPLVMVSATICTAAIATWFVVS